MEQVFLEKLLSPRGQVLFLLHIIKQPMYAREIANLLDLSEMTVSSRIHEFEEEGLIEKEERQIGNAILYKLTDSGKKYAKQILEEARKMINLQIYVEDFQELIRKDVKPLKSDIATKTITDNKNLEVEIN